jgi:protein-tyrosine kinase
MSIVEKAIDKLRGSRTESATTATRVVEQGARRPPVTPSPPRYEPATPQPSIFAKVPPGAPVTIDPEALRNQHLLPPIEHERRTADEFRRLKWPLLTGALGRGGERLAAGNLIMVGSALPGDGKTFTSLNLALAMASERDCSVLLIDADAAKGHVSSALGVRGRKGLTDLLNGGVAAWHEVILETTIPGLRVVPCGSHMSATPELFASQRMQALVADLAAAEPDCVVIFDSSPLLATNESQVLTRYVGQVLLVVRANVTPRNAVLEAVGLIDEAKPTAFVLNDAQSFLGGGKYYGYYQFDGSGSKQEGGAG